MAFVITRREVAYLDIKEVPWLFVKYQIQMVIYGWLWRSMDSIASQGNEVVDDGWVLYTDATIKYRIHSDLVRP